MLPERHGGDAAIGRGGVASAAPDIDDDRGAVVTVALEHVRGSAGAPVCRDSRNWSREVLDNNVCYKARRFTETCTELGIRHRPTRPYTLGTSGKAERFIQSALREWAYVRAYGTSAQRINALPRWLHDYS
jgi:transposase InsO family protein